MLTWRDDETFEIGGIEYACRPAGRRFRSEPGHFCLLKPRSDVEHYEKLLIDLQPKRIVEVGMYDGASAALFTEIAQPEKLVTIDRRARTSEALTHFIATRGFHDTVSAYCGVDQGDANRLRAVLHDALASERIDLVVDDASHLVEPTRRTFNCVFPHLRPGGTYAIEDWAWAHTALSGPWSATDEVPLTVFVFELVLACAYSPSVISNVDVFRNMTLITRGDAALDTETFDISACVGTTGRKLIADARSRNAARVVAATMGPPRNGSGPWSLAKSVPASASAPTPSAH